MNKDERIIKNKITLSYLIGLILAVFSYFIVMKIGWNSIIFISIPFIVIIIFAAINASLIKKLKKLVEK